MLNASEVHEQRIFTADYKTVTPLSLHNLTIGDEREDESVQAQLNK